MDELVFREAVLSRETSISPTVDGDILVGYAIVYNQRSQLITENGQTFYEIITPGAFSESIKSRNITFTFHHSDNSQYGDTASGTLTLTEDAKGIAFRLTVPAYASTLRSKIGSGAIRGMSFGFVPTDVTMLDATTRAVNRGILHHISPVYSPAYPMTEVRLEPARRDILQLKLLTYEKWD